MMAARVRGSEASSGAMASILSPIFSRSRARASAFCAISSKVLRLAMLSKYQRQPTNNTSERHAQVVRHKPMKARWEPMEPEVIGVESVDA